MQFGANIESEIYPKIKVFSLITQDLSWHILSECQGPSAIFSLKHEKWLYFLIYLADMAGVEGQRWVRKEWQSWCISYRWSGWIESYDRERKS